MINKSKSGNKYLKALRNVPLPNLFLLMQNRKILKKVMRKE